MWNELLVELTLLAIYNSDAHRASCHSKLLQSAEVDCMPGLQAVHSRRYWLSVAEQAAAVASIVSHTGGVANADAASNENADVQRLEMRKNSQTPSHLVVRRSRDVGREPEAGHKHLVDEMKFGFLEERMTVAVAGRCQQDKIAATVGSDPEVVRI